MPTLREVSDVVRRRVGQYMLEDGVFRVYAVKQEDLYLLQFVLDTDTNYDKLTKSSMRYLHAFDDKQKDYKIKFYNLSAVMHKDENTFLLYERGKGFIIL